MKRALVRLDEGRLGRRRGPCSRRPSYSSTSPRPRIQPRRSGAKARLRVAAGPRGVVQTDGSSSPPPGRPGESPSVTSVNGTPTSRPVGLRRRPCAVRGERTPNRSRLMVPPPFAGITRIRFNGRRQSGALSARSVRAPVGPVAPTAETDHNSLGAITAADGHHLHEQISELRLALLLSALAGLEHEARQKSAGLWTDTWSRRCGVAHADQKVRLHRRTRSGRVVSVGRPYFRSE